MKPEIKEARADAVRSPDGQSSKAPPRSGPTAIRFVGAVISAIGAFIRTIWRLAEALDSALWRGLKLSVLSIARFIGASARASAAAFAEVFRWLPSRGGRAYAAGSAIVLAFCALWAVDEIRNARADAAAFNSIFRPPIDLDDPIVARVDGRYVHLSEVAAAARAGGQIQEGEELTVEAAFARELVAAYVEQRLLARAAVEEGLQRDPSVQRRLNAARDRILAASYMEGRIETAVTPARIRRLYDSQSDVTRLGDEVNARHILVATEEEAQAIVADLATGGDFGAIARARSLDRATAELGGEVGWFTRDMMTPAFSSPAFSAAVGETAPPFETEFGWHVLQVTGRRPTGAVAFGAVEDNVRRFLTLRAINQTLDALKEDEEVTFFPPEDEDDGLRR